MNTSTPMREQLLQVLGKTVTYYTQVGLWLQMAIIKEVTEDSVLLDNEGDKPFWVPISMISEIVRVVK